MIPSLPHELSDRIVDFLHDDCLALSSCSLTSRSWLPAARYHRFSSVTLVGNIEPFNVLLDYSPDIALFVSTLVLANGYVLSRRLTPQCLSSLLDRLPAVRRLDLLGLTLKPEMVEIIAKQLSLVSFSAMGCSFDTSGSIQHLLSSLPCLERLTVEDLLWQDDGGLIDNMPRPKLRAFRVAGLDHPAIDQLCTWLLQDGLDSNIRELCACIREKHDAIATQAMLEKLGSSLTALDLIVDAESNLTVVFDHCDFSLACLSNLRSCHLGVNLREMCVPDNNSLPWISRLIGTLSSKYLESATITIKADNMQDLRSLDSECGVRVPALVSFDDLTALDWVALGNVLDKGKLPSLRQVVLEGVGRKDRLESYLRLVYPDLHDLIDFVNT